MSLNTLSTRQVDQLSGAPLTDDVLTGAITQALEELEGSTTGEDIQASFAEKIDAWLDNLGELSYVAQPSNGQQYSVTIAGTPYTFASMEDFEVQLERASAMVLDTMELSELLSEEAIKASIAIEEQKLQINQKAATLQNNIYATQELLTHLRTSPHPSMSDIVTESSDLYKQLDAYAGNSFEQNMQKINDTGEQFIGKYMAGLNIPQRNKEIIRMATHMQLMTLSAGEEESESLLTEGEGLFADGIDLSNPLQQMLDRTGSIGLQNALHMRGLLSFFTIFRDKDIQASLEKSRTADATGNTYMLNYYCENAYEFKKLLADYLAEDAKTRDASLKKKLLDASTQAQTLTPEIQKKFILDEAEQQELANTINTFSISEEATQSFMNYIDKGDKLLEQTDAIKEKMLENPAFSSFGVLIGQVQKGLHQLGKMFGAEDRGKWKFLDTLFVLVGFDGVDGYMDERYMQKEIIPLVDTYTSLQATSAPSATSYQEHIATLVTNTTQGDLAAAIDTDVLYATLKGKQDIVDASGKIHTAKDLLKPKQFSKLVSPRIYEQYTAGSIDERALFDYATACVVDRVVSSHLAGDPLDMQKVMKWTTLFLVHPGRAQKYITLQDARERLGGEESTPEKDGSSHSEEFDTAPSKSTILAAIDTLDIDFKNPETRSRLYLMSSDVLELLSTVGHEFPGMRVTSTIRTPEENQAVGGEIDSQHLYGHAFDIGRPSATYDAAKLDEYKAYFETIKEHIDQQFPEYYTLIHGEGSHMHLHVDTGEPKDEIITDQDIRSNAGDVV